MQGITGGLGWVLLGVATTSPSTNRIACIEYYIIRTVSHLERECQKIVVATFSAGTGYGVSPVSPWDLAWSALPVCMLAVDV